MLDTIDLAIFFKFALKFVQTSSMKIRRKPHWLKIRFPKTHNFAKVDKVLKQYNLHTICVSGKCPNLGECWDAGTATIMILGNICTRACKFCAVRTGKPLAPDPSEPRKVAEAIKQLGIKHVVLTSVDRDDLEDKGSGIWALTIKTIKTLTPWVTIEALIPDFDAIPQFLDKVIHARPEIISHNMETIRRLTPKLRSKATYENSLKVLEYIASKNITAKTGLMVGLGETAKEVYQFMDDVLSVGVKILTIGQYLQPTPKNYPVYEYVKPEVFERYKKVALEKGFTFVESGPLVRSSYHAEKQVNIRAIENNIISHTLPHIQEQQIIEIEKQQDKQKIDILSLLKQNSMKN